MRFPKEATDIRGRVFRKRPLALRPAREEYNSNRERSASKRVIMKVRRVHFPKEHAKFPKHVLMNW